MDKGLAHSHITGLGVDRTMNITEDAGLFSMENARKAASLFTDMITNKRIAGKVLLIAGESGSGKTALAVGISKDLGMRVPFVRMAGSEVYSATLRKTEILQQAIRRATTVRIREIKNVYEGEVVDVKIEEREDPLDNYRKTISNVFISLRSAKRTERLTLNPSLSQEIVRQKITVGDIIYIEPEENIIKKIGRSDSYASEFDIESDKYVPLPKGDIFTKKEVLQEMTLHEIDVANTKSKGKDVYSVMSHIQGQGRTEISSKIREDVDIKVNMQLSTGSAEITPGVLFIDESHMLDVDCYAFLGTLLELPTCPVVILATNKSIIKVPGSDEKGHFGIPSTFTSRMYIVRTEKPTGETIRKIISQKIAAEGIKISNEGREHLYSIAEKTSLRFAFGLLPLAALISEEITAEAIEEVSHMFSSPK